MKDASGAKTPKEYIAKLAEPRKSEIAELDAFIRKTAPALKPFILAGMLAYGPYHYVYESGREGDWFIVGLSSRANYISLYVCAVADGKYLAESYKKRLPKTSIGKSCVRFKKLSDIDLKVVAEMLKEAEVWAKKQPGFKA
jgi:Domain of unknown function (DU1801)